MEVKQKDQHTLPMDFDNFLLTDLLHFIYLKPGESDVESNMHNASIDGKK